MALYPALPLFTDAYLADTRHLTTEEHGAYLLLLMCAWRSADCALEDNDKTLARIAGLSPTKWRRLKPALAQFFTIEAGLWRQKKLQAVYSDVAARVARNKANGARGGRAKAAKACRLDSMSGQKKGRQKPSQMGSKTGGKNTASAQAAKTKSKTKQKQPPAADVSLEQKKDRGRPLSVEQQNHWRSSISDVCPEGTIMDDAVLHVWWAAGVDLTLDIIPTITAVAVRELARTGRAPHSLGYFREAVLEASADRQKAEQSGKRFKPAAKTPQAQKQVFDLQNADHWCRLLGDPNNRFQGDHMARNWFIPTDHPTFRERGLGTNPRLSVTGHIPRIVRDRYGAVWGWL